MPTTTMPSGPIAATAAAGRQRREGSRPSGNSSGRTMKASASSAIQYQLCSQAPRTATASGRPRVVMTHAA
jgi:hypothetical protein